MIPSPISEGHLVCVLPMLEIVYKIQKFYLNIFLGSFVEDPVDLQDEISLWIYITFKYQTMLCVIVLHYCRIKDNTEKIMPFLLLFSQSDVFAIIEGFRVMWLQTNAFSPSLPPSLPHSFPEVSNPPAQKQIKVHKMWNVRYLHWSHTYNSCTFIYLSLNIVRLKLMTPCWVCDLWDQIG